VQQWVAPVLACTDNHDDAVAVSRITGRSERDPGRAARRWDIGTRGGRHEARRRQRYGNRPYRRALHRQGDE